MYTYICINTDLYVCVHIASLHCSLYMRLRVRERERAKTHPKTLVRYGLLAWTRVSANSEKCIGSRWAGWGRDCSRDSGKAEQPDCWVWYKSS